MSKKDRTIKIGDIYRTLNVYRVEITGISAGQAMACVAEFDSRVETSLIDKLLLTPVGMAVV